MKIETFFLKTIVQILKMIVYSNILIKNQRYISFDQFHKIVLRIRKVYQNLIKCDIMSKKTFFIFTVIVEKNQEMNNFANENDNENTKNNFILFVDETNYNHMTKIL